MSGTLNMLHPENPKRIALIAANPSTSPITGWPVGFWWAELTHPFWEFMEQGYHMQLFSPDGGALKADNWSDPEDESGYSKDDLISLGFKTSPKYASLIEATLPIAQFSPDEFDAIFLVGGQSPMVTFFEHDALHQLVADFFESGKPTAIVCHATCILLKARKANGKLLVDGKTWTGFANSEEEYADQFVGKKIQPFWIEEEAKKLSNTNFIVNGRFRSHALRDGNLITGQQQYSGKAAARLVIQALGV